MRTIIQAVSLVLFSLLFALATYRLPNWLPPDIYLRLDPLLGMNAVFAAREIIGRALWALITIGSTLLIGRFFCAYVCPMGASIDFLDFLLFRKRKRLGLKTETGLRRTKYFLLVIFIVAALTGLSLAFLMDPNCLHSFPPLPAIFEKSHISENRYSRLYRRSTTPSCPPADPKASHS
jgi:polyferredoxin